jgi:plasmid replication initiation protein
MTTQLALAFFEDFAQFEKSVVEAPSEIGFKRNNILIDINELSLAARKAFDVIAFMIFHDPSNYQKTIETDLAFFHWLMAYNSNNRTHFKGLLREVQKGAVLINEIDPHNELNDRWVSVPLLGTAGIANGKLYLEVPDKLQKAIKNPVNSHYLSLRIVFKSVHSKVLYDHVLPYLDDGLTPWFSTNVLRTWLGCTGKTYDEFKYLNSALKKAIKEISEHKLANLSINIVTQNVPGSKKVGEVRFQLKVTKSKEETQSPMMLLKELYDILSLEIGLSRSQFSEITSNRDVWTDVYIRQAIDYTRFNIEKGRVRVSVSGFFMKALHDGYNVGTADLALFQASKTDSINQPKRAKAPEIESPDAIDRKSRVTAALVRFEALPAVEQNTVVGEFNQAAVIHKRLKPGSVIFQKTLGTWLVDNEDKPVAI